MSDLDKELQHLHCEIKALRRSLAVEITTADTERYTALMIEMVRLERAKAHRRAEHMKVTR